MLIVPHFTAGLPSLFAADPLSYRLAAPQSYLILELKVQRDQRERGSPAGKSCDQYMIFSRGLNGGDVSVSYLYRTGLLLRCRNDVSRLCEKIHTQLCI